MFVPIDPRFPDVLGRVRRWPYVRTVLNQALYLPSLERLRTVDVVHVFSASYWSFLLAVVPAIVAAGTFGKRAVLHYHSGEAEDHLANWGVLVHPWLRLVDAIVVPSEYLRGVFARHGYRAHVVPNVVDVARFECPDRPVLRPRLLSARNLDPYYRVDNSIAAFAQVRRQFTDATLTVAGDGSERKQLERLVDTLGVGGVRFVGWVPPDGMPALYREADIFVNSSVVDNQPVSVLEAFAAGLPVVSTATGDIAALVRHEETGLIVRPDDPAGMAAAVAALLERQDVAQRLIRRARLEVETFSWPVVREQWAAVYRGAVA
jgi:glycosyltransferase involved in cell wall biosynthesis